MFELRSFDVCGTAYSPSLGSHILFATHTCTTMAYVALGVKCPGPVKAKWQRNGGDIDADAINSPQRNRRRYDPTVALKSPEGRPESSSVQSSMNVIVPMCI